MRALRAASAAGPLVVIGLAFWACGVTGQDKPTKPPIKPAEQRAAHLARMKELAKSIQVFATPGRADSEAKLVTQPVLRYSDSTRKNPEASLWIWGASGRPTALMALEYYENGPQGTAWLYEIASLSTERIAARREGMLEWAAKEPGLKLATLADAPAPEVKDRIRLSQMKKLCGRFAVHENSVIGGRIELRPLASPLYRYDDERAGVLDGAIFSFANGTNPEVLLVLEAHTMGSVREWKYGLVQMAGAEVFVALDGKEVWTRGNADPPAVRDSYVNGWIPIETAD